jgi:Fic family protein
VTKAYTIPELPLRIDLETKAVLKRLAPAHRRLAELKGVSRTIPNEEILINTLTLQEAKDSSAIENIITTHDELFKAELFIESLTSPAAKEVQNYAYSLRQGFDALRRDKLLTEARIIQIQEGLERNKAGYRRVPGTEIRNQQTGQTVYVPPQDPETIKALMRNLVDFLNDHEMSDLDPLIKLAIIHHQFESIHPFYDGNGRTGRIINILYLVINDLLELPVLYLSRFFIQHKSEYYKLLQAVRDKGNWEDWVLFALQGIEETALQTVDLIANMRALMADYKKRLRADFPKLYSQDLLNNLFRHPYTKIEFIEHELGVTRKTASGYLRQLVEHDYLRLVKVGRSNFYMNDPLIELFLNAHHREKAGPTVLIESV